MSRKKVQIKKTLGQQTEDKLMKYILDNQVAIGEKIPNEFELTEIFSVGRSTIREAVKGLVSRGVLEIRRGDGTYVVSTVYMENDVLGFGQIKDRYQLALDLFDVRLMIEPEIVTWACRKATKRSLMQETLETHRAIVTSIERKDPVGAKCAMNMHLTYNRQVIMELLEKRKKSK